MQQRGNFNGVYGHARAMTAPIAALRSRITGNNPAPSSPTPPATRPVNNSGGRRPMFQNQSDSGNGPPPVRARFGGQAITRTAPPSAQSSPQISEMERQITQLTTQVTELKEELVALQTTHTQELESLFTQLEMVSLGKVRTSPLEVLHLYTNTNMDSETVGSLAAGEETYISAPFFTNDDGIWGVSQSISIDTAGLLLQTRYCLVAVPSDEGVYRATVEILD